MDAVAPPGPPAPADDAPHTLPPTPLGQLSLVLAGLALAGFAVAIVLLAIPVQVPGVQQCGAPGAYLVDGRLDVVPDANDQILGPEGDPITLDAEDAQSARDHPCRERVADRAVPAGILILTSTVVGLGAFAVEVLMVRPRRRRAWRAVAGLEPPTD